MTEILGGDFRESSKETGCEQDSVPALFVLIYAPYAPEIPGQTQRAERPSGPGWMLSQYLDDVENVLRGNGIAEYHYVNFFEGVNSTARLAICAYAHGKEALDLHEKIRAELPKGPDGEDRFHAFVTNRHVATPAPNGDVISTIHLKIGEMVNERLSANMIATVSLRP